MPVTRMIEAAFRCDWCEHPAPEEERHLGLAGLFWLWNGRAICLPCVVTLVGEADRCVLEEQLRRMKEREG